MFLIRMAADPNDGKNHLGKTDVDHNEPLKTLIKNDKELNEAINFLAEKQKLP